jgi:hypothetical protein
LSGKALRTAFSPPALADRLTSRLQGGVLTS